MISLIDGPAIVEPKAPAQANNSGIPDSTPESDGEANNIPNQTKNKAHCFCPKLAAEHGEETAVIFQGLGYKIAKSKKVHDGRRWHYDTLAALEERWPYLSDSGIGGILERHFKAGRVFKGHFNRWAPDRTNWYSMPEDLVKRATEDLGKIWFDVPAAIKCHSIIAGTLYQNLRYHLLLFLAEHPEFEGVPYHKVNKAALARVLPWSLSTIKREYKELLKNGLIAENPMRAGEYTLCNGSDLAVPDSMMKIGSSTVKNGSSAEMPIGSPMEMTGSSTEKSVSSTGEIGSSAVSDNHLKPFKNTIHKHHSPTATPAVGGVGVNAADAAKDVHHDIRHNSGSAPVPGKENEPSSPSWDLDTIRDRITTLLPSIRESEQGFITRAAPTLSHYFMTDEIGYAALKFASTCTVPAEIIAIMYADIHAFAYEHGAGEEWSDSGCELFFLSCLEIVTGVLLLYGAKPAVLEPKLKHWWVPIKDIYENHTSDLWERKDAPAADKAEMFVEEIRIRNHDGWPTYNHGELTYTVPPSKDVQKAATDFFMEHTNQSAQDTWIILSDCVEVKKLNRKPNGFDPLFHARKGVRPQFLFKHWDTINAELDDVGTLAS